MKSRIDGKEATDLFLAAGAIAFIPLAGWLLRPRPLSASTTTELIEAARTQRADKIVEGMHQIFNTNSLSFEKPRVRLNLNDCWQRITVELREEGAKNPEYVARVARREFGDAWPVVVEQGYLHGDPVWIVVGSSQYDTGFIAWICPPSANDIRREKEARYCTDLHVAAVNVEPPHNLLR